MECAACCVWKCRLWLHLLFLPLPFRQKQSVQPIVCILPNNRKPISANIFPSPNATAGFGCFKRQRKRERKRVKKLDRQWLERNIVLPGRSQHPLRGCIFHTEIIANVLLCNVLQSERLAAQPTWSRGWSGASFRKTVSWKLCPLLQTCLYWKTRSMLI